MKKVISSERIPIKLWLDDIDDGTMEQIINISNLPFAFSHIAIMPDAHVGYGMPIGGVLATDNVIISSAVGSDIGCGMNVIKTNITGEVERNILIDIMKNIREKIPLGFNWHREPQDLKYFPDSRYKPKSLEVVNKEFEKAQYQIGTLGSGNHFCSIERGSDDHVWIMIHSGSRNIGKKVGDYYDKLSKDLNKKWHSSVPKEWDLSFLPFRTEEGLSYFKEMTYCIDFARANREYMMKIVSDIFRKIFKDKFEIEFSYDIHHNFATFENHFRKNVIVHRKGATRAYNGEYGIIPGSQGTNSYIVSGKGNVDSFKSCSHGAGRKLGRKNAIRTLDLEKEKELLNSKGIIHCVRSKDDLDESPGAYKDIKSVMKLQEDLVDILVELTPMAVIKGIKIKKEKRKKTKET